MGISIHYSGKFRNTSDISVFVDEVIDLSKTLHWNHQFIPPDPDVPIEGVIVYIEGCDPIVLTFLPGGRLCHPLFYSYLKEVEQMEKIETADQWIITQTQDAGPDVHMELIRIMHYLDEKYFEHFLLNDNSKYWETNDEDQCRQAFVKNKDLMEFPSNELIARTVRKRNFTLKNKIRKRD